jgi:hypothetical protein
MAAFHISGGARAGSTLRPCPLFAIRIRHCVASAGRSLVVLSGGSKVDDDRLPEIRRAILHAVRE